MYQGIPERKEAMSNTRELKLSRNDSAAGPRRRVPGPLVSVDVPVNTMAVSQRQRQAVPPLGAERERHD